MNSSSRSELIVGLTVTLAVLILVAGIIWGKRVEFFPQRVYMTVRFDDVEGLAKEDPVLIRGTKQGEVEGIVLKPDHAEVRLWIRKDIPLYTDLTIAVEMAELLGGKKITIDPGKNGQPADLHQTFTGQSRGDMMTMFTKVESILNRADTTLRKLNTFLDTDHINQVLRSVEQTTDQARFILTENRQPLKSTVDRLERITRTFEEDSILLHTGTVIARLDTTIQLIKQITLRMETEQGTIGKLLHDRWLFDQLLKTTNDLDSLILDIKANPKKYIHFSIF